jgi:poly(hydroxyalkanoate) granule-associated protein
MATTTEPPEEGKSGPQEKASEPVVDALRQVWLAGLGALAGVGQQGERLFQSLVEKGREFEPTVYEHSKKAAEEMKHAASGAGSWLKELAEKIGQGAGKAEAALDEKVTASLRRMGFITKEEVAALSQKIEELTARLEQIQAERGTTPTDKP